MKKILLLWFVPILLFSQNKIPRDTSFTASNMETKIVGEFPNVKLVVSKLPEGITLHENLVYSKKGERELHLDLFEPADKNNYLFPAVLIIHGGGWRSGDRKMEWPAAQHIAAYGYVTAAVEYRLSPEALYPAGIYDLKAAVRWIRANAKKYNIDPYKIAAYGTSAGGELSAFLGTTGDIEKFEGDGGNSEYSSKVNAVVDVDGIVDFTHPAECAKDTIPNKTSAGRAWFGSLYIENPEPWIEASPFNYVSKNSAPIIFINSSQKQFRAGRDYMIEKLNYYKIYSEVHELPNTKHGFWMFHPWFDECLQYTVRFLDKTLKGK